jgi:hypothetical protein
MKIARTLGLVLIAAIVPAVAAAQPDPTTTNTNSDPNTPPAPTTPTAGSTTDPMPPPPPPTTTTTTNTTTTPPPVVIVNPPPTAPRTTTYVAPEGEDVYDSWNAPVFATGALVFAGSYGAAAIASGMSDHPGADRLWVPVAGPWLALNDWGNCPITQSRCDTTTTDKVLLITDGVFQAAGLITMVDGLLSPSHHRVVTRTADKKLHVEPTGNGFAVFGQF